MKGRLVKVVVWFVAGALTFCGAVYLDRVAKMEWFVTLGYGLISLLVLGVLNKILNEWN